MHKRISEQESTYKGSNKCPENGQPLFKSAPAKTATGYWRDRVKPVIGRGGRTSPNYSVRITHQKKRTRFPLYTGNKEAASSRAAEIYRYIICNGWDEALAKYKPHTLESTGPLKADTVGDLIKSSTALSSARPQSKDAYVKAFRRLVAGIGGITKQKNTPNGRSYDDWCQRVDALKLQTITPAKVIAWKNDYLDKHGTDPLAIKSAKTTVNSIIRNSKALFSKKIIPFLIEEVELPNPLPLEGVPLEKPSSMRYHSKIDAAKILSDAKDQLTHTDPEQYKALLLALVCGLRISEIDHLLWDSFDFERKILRIESTRYHELKTVDSEGEIDLTDDMLATFRGFKARAKDIFVIESSRQPRPKSSIRHYRCSKVFELLRQWLRIQGVTGKMPIHELRKEVGSLIAAEHGIFEASRYLRHSDIRITASVYLDRKKRVTPALSLTTSEEPDVSSFKKTESADEQCMASAPKNTLAR